MADTREKLIELIGRTPCCGFSSVAAVESGYDMEVLREYERKRSEGE